MEQREFEALPERIDALDAERSAIASRIESPNFYKETPDAIAATLARAETIERELSELYARWDALDSRAARAQG